MTEDQANAAEAAQQTPDLPHGPAFAHRVDMPQPIKRLGQGMPDLTALYLKEPVAGELRGIRMGDLLQFDADALIELLPRIARPRLSPDEAAALHLKNLIAFGNKVATFLQ